MKRIRKDNSSVSSHIINGETNSCAKGNTTILNNQFEFFTNEDLSNIPIMTSDATPQMPSISFSAHGIQLLLENLVLGKAPGPDGLTTYIFKHRASKIAPILQMLLCSLLILVHFQKIGLLPILHQFIRKTVEAYHLIIDQYLLTSVCIAK